MSRRKFESAEEVEKATKAYESYSEAYNYIIEKARAILDKMPEEERPNVVKVGAGHIGIYDSIGRCHRTWIEPKDLIIKFGGDITKQPEMFFHYIDKEHNDPYTGFSFDVKIKSPEKIKLKDYLHEKIPFGIFNKVENIKNHTETKLYGSLSGILSVNELEGEENDAINNHNPERSTYDIIHEIEEHDIEYFKEQVDWAFSQTATVEMAEPEENKEKKKVEVEKTINSAIASHDTGSRRPVLLCGFSNEHKQAKGSESFSAQKETVEKSVAEYNKSITLPVILQSTKGIEK